MIPLGIDLGTTYCKVACLQTARNPVLIPDIHAPDVHRTPSVVHVGAQGCLVGHAAETYLEENPQADLERHVKLKMGRQAIAFTDETGQAWSPEAASALILKKLKRDAEEFLSGAVGSAVVTIPSQFGDSERRATRTAVQMAGIDLIKLVEEPVAAAAYYGFGEVESDKTLFIYDLGGGTLDATLVQASPDGLHVLSTLGSNSLGGKWFDEAVMEVLALQFKKGYGVDPLEDPISREQLRRTAEEAKIRLSSLNTGQVRKTLILRGRAGEVVLTRSLFEQVISNMIEESIEVCRRCLSDAMLDWRDINALLLVGGSTLTPVVRERLQKDSGLNAALIHQRQPHHAVAYGAALLAAAEERVEAVRLPRLTQQIATCALGISVKKSHNAPPDIEILIPRNSPLPCIVTKDVFTSRDDQRRIVLEFVQVKCIQSEPQSLGTFVFGPIQNPRKYYKVTIRVCYDSEGIISVTAHDPAEGKTMAYEIDETRLNVQHVDMEAEQNLVSRALIIA